MVMVYLPTNLPSKSTVHVDKITILPWILWLHQRDQRMEKQYTEQQAIEEMLQHNIPNDPRVAVWAVVVSMVKNVWQKKTM